MTEQEFNKLLDAAADDLPREIQPPRDLWVGIDHAIEMRANSRKQQTNKFYKIAAVLIMLIGGGWVFYAGLGFNNTSSNEVDLTMLAHDIDRGFRRQKANILAVYEGQPALTTTWRDQLEELEVARSSIWKAVQKDPGNEYMIQILMEIQQQQLDLIEGVHITRKRDI